MLQGSFDDVGIMINASGLEKGRDYRDVDIVDMQFDK